jgi:hypothetical protein
MAGRRYGKLRVIRRAGSLQGLYADESLAVWSAAIASRNEGNTSRSKSPPHLRVMRLGRKSDFSLQCLSKSEQASSAASARHKKAGGAIGELHRRP